MRVFIDTTFDFYSDTPIGRDPDTYSPALRQYHRCLWSKTLPSGQEFTLSDNVPGFYLRHESKLGQIALSSDSIGHTYRYVKATAATVSQLTSAEVDEFFRICSTIGAYIIFPSQRIEGKPTINGARGLSSKIKDRFDLTLECIKLHYLGKPSPLAVTLRRYSNFFDLFGSFEGYVEFFLPQDLVLDDGRSINFFLPFRSFDDYPLPTGVDQYRVYKAGVISFVTARNRRISLQD